MEKQISLTHLTHFSCKYLCLLKGFWYIAKVTFELKDTVLDISALGHAAGNVRATIFDALHVGELKQKFLVNIYI